MPVIEEPKPRNLKAEAEAAMTEDTTPKKLAKVTTGVKKKKSWLSNLTQTFIGEEASTVGSYIFYDVLIPAVKDTIIEMTKTGIEMLFYGESRGGRSNNVRRDRTRSVVSYQGFWDKDKPTRREAPRAAKALQNFDDIVIRSRVEAEEVLSNLVDVIEQYDVVSVAAFYDLVGLTSESDIMDNKYGWDNLSQATVNRVRDGYVLALPKPIELS